MPNLIYQQSIPMAAILRRVSIDPAQQRTIDGMLVRII
jgi:hypothetical protein